MATLVQLGRHLLAGIAVFCLMLMATLNLAMAIDDLLGDTTALDGVSEHWVFKWSGRWHDTAALADFGVGLFRDLLSYASHTPSQC